MAGSDREYHPKTGKAAGRIPSTTRGGRVQVPFHNLSKSIRKRSPAKSKGIQVERSEYSLFRLLKTAKNVFPMELIFAVLLQPFKRMKLSAAALR